MGGSGSLAGSPDAPRPARFAGFDRNAAAGAMLSGANDPGSRPGQALLAIRRWGQRLTPKALEALGITRRRVPARGGSVQQEPVVKGGAQLRRA